MQYLDLGDAKTRLVEYGIYQNAQSLPADVVLTDIIEEIERRVDLYLGYTVGERDFTLKIEASIDGIIFLPHYPIVSVYSVRAYLPEIVSNNANSSESYSEISVWSKGNSIYVGQGYTHCLVRYRAGKEDQSVLSAVKMVVFNTLKTSCQESLDVGGIPDLSFLSAPTFDETSLSLPGGLSHSLQAGTPSGQSRGIPGKGTAEERLFSPLSSYRRLYRL